MAQVVPEGFVGAPQVSGALVGVPEATARVGALSDPAVASAYVPDPVEEK
jgi:hypothetical protein